MAEPPLSSKELVRRTLRGEPCPRVPTGPLAVHYCARVSDLSVRRYTTDARALAESVLRYHERFRPDAVWLSADTWVSAGAMGAKVGATGDDQPFGGVGPPLVKSPRDIDRIPPPDVGRAGRYPLMLEALAHIVGAVGDEVCVVACFDQYPFSLAAALMGLNEIMVKVADDPPFVEALMERCLEYALAYGRALGDAGADLLSGGDSPAGLLGPERYRSTAWPFEKRLIAELKSRIPQPVSLHICGDATRLLPAMAATGADVLELDHRVDLREAVRRVDPSLTIWGNLDPVGVLAQGSPADVTTAAAEVLEAMRAGGHRRFVLSSGCTLAMETPPENLDALMRASRQPP